MRKYTNELLEMIENQLLDRDTVITAFCNHMSEDDVKEMMQMNDFLTEEENEEGEN